MRCKLTSSQARLYVPGRERKASSATIAASNASVKRERDTGYASSPVKAEPGTSSKHPKKSRPNRVIDLTAD